MATDYLSSSSLSIPQFTFPPRFPPSSDLPPALNLPPPDPPPSEASSIQPSQPPPLPLARWTSLFATKPRSAGDFIPPAFTLKYSGKSLIPTEDIISASVEVWHEYISGFFLDSPLSYSVVVSHLKNLWKPGGSIKVKSNGNMFFFLLSDLEDRKKILEADPIIIRNKVFVIKKWDVNMGNSGKGIKNVPIWIKFINMPMVTWSLIGISWLASHVGRFLCMDKATESLDWLGYAKVMVEITPNSELPETIPVLLPDGTEHVVSVIYTWKPDMCQACKAFGHSLENCNVSGCSTEADKGKIAMNNSGMNNSRKEDKSPQVDEVVVHQKRAPRRQAKPIPSRSSHKVRVAPSLSLLRWSKVDQTFAKRNKENNQRENATATSNRFEILDKTCDELDSENTTRANDESEVIKLSSIVENEELEAAASDNDGYIDIPLPVFSEARFGPVVVQTGTALHVPPAVNEDTELGSKADDMEFEEGEVRQYEEHEGEENGIAVMKDLADEVQSFGTDLCNEKETGETSNVANVICQHGEVNLVVDLTEAKQNDQVNKELSDSENLHKPLDTFLQQNLNDNVWQDPSPDNCETMDERDELTPHINQLTDLLEKELAVEGNSPDRIATLQLKLTECTNILPKLSSGEIKKEWTKSITSLLKNNIREHQRRPTPTSDNVSSSSKSPYENIAPPPGHKPRPLDILFDLAPTSSGEAALPKTPITRRMKKEMMKNQHENG